jgi:hypothetical protein
MDNGGRGGQVRFWVCLECRLVGRVNVLQGEEKGVKDDFKVLAKWVNE